MPAAVIVTVTGCCLIAIALIAVLLWDHRD